MRTMQRVESDLDVIEESRSNAEQDFHFNHRSNAEFDEQLIDIEESHSFSLRAIKKNELNVKTSN